MTKLFYIPIIVFFVAGCAVTTKPPINYINTPTYCDIEVPKKPSFLDGATNEVNLTRLLIYTDELEMALYCCTGDSRCIVKEKNLLISEKKFHVKHKKES